MSGRVLLRFALTLTVCAVAFSGCGSAAKRDPPLRGTRLEIYSSLPRRGPLRALAAETLAAERLALAQDGGRVGRYRVQLDALDASTVGAGRSDPGQISQNAGLAAQDPSTVAYLGEMATGTSAIAIPLLNEAGILEVSPLDPAMALTTGSLAIAGSPERFYPKIKDGGRTFARVVPSDRSEVDALLAAMRENGVRRLALLTDEDPTGRALTTDLQAKARAAGIAIVVSQEIDEQALRDDGSIAQVLAARPDAALDATGARPRAARLWRELTAADPLLQLYAPASLADPSFVAALGPAAAVAHVTQPLPGDGGAVARRFVRAFAARYGYVPSPQARFGYEAMRGVLAAIRRAEADVRGGRITRAQVVHAYFRTAPRASVLGPYAIDAAGDTSLRWWGMFDVVDGELRLVAALDAASGKR